MKRLLCLTLLALVALPVFSQTRAPRSLAFASDFQTVAVMGNTPGAGGSRFQTRVSILNPTTSAFAVTASLYDAVGTKRDATINLAAGELKTYDNFLDAVFGYTGGGAVTFSSPASAGGTHNNRFIVDTEIWTATGGRYGTSIPALEFPGSSSPAFSAGITVDTSARTNIGCFNQSNSINVVTAKVLDKTGSLTLGTFNLTLGTNAWGQTAVTSVVSDGVVRFEPSDAAVCYAVVVSNTTNDGRFISAVEYTP